MKHLHKIDNFIITIPTPIIKKIKEINYSVRNGFISYEKEDVYSEKFNVDLFSYPPFELNKLEYNNRIILHYITISETIVETNMLHSILNPEILENIYQSYNYINNEVAYNKKIKFRILQNTKGANVLFLIINNILFGPLLFEEILSGYYNYDIAKFILNKIDKKYYPFLRTIEYKKLYPIYKIDNEKYILINDEYYKLNSISSSMLKNKEFLPIAYIKIYMKDYSFVKINDINNAIFDYITFYDIKLKPIAKIIYDKTEDNIKWINLVSYFFPYILNGKEYIPEAFTSNLQFYYSIDTFKLKLNL